MKQHNLPKDPKEIVDLCEDDNNNAEHIPKAEAIVKVEQKIKVEGRSTTSVNRKDPPVAEIKVYHDPGSDDQEEEDKENDKDDNKDNKDNKANDGCDAAADGAYQDCNEHEVSQCDPKLIPFPEYLTFCKVVQNRVVGYLSCCNKFFPCDVCTKNLQKQISHDAHANWCRQSSFFKNKMKDSCTILEERGVPQRLVDYFSIVCGNAEPVLPAPREVLYSDPPTPSTSDSSYRPKKQNLEKHMDDEEDRKLPAKKTKNKDKGSKVNTEKKVNLEKKVIRKA